jgi:hypothetical protein
MVFGAPTAEESKVTEKETTNAVQMMESGTADNSSLIKQPEVKVLDQ